MCGIAAYIQGLEPEDNNPVNEVTGMVRRLVYRGYDSWGYATSNGHTVKNVGEIPEKFGIDEKEAEAEACIGHCLAPDTKVITSKGVIKDISELDSKKVKSFDFEEYSETEKEYTKYSHESPDKIYEIKSTYSKFEATGEHKLFVAENGEIKTKKVKNLSGNELIPATSKIPHQKTSQPKFKDIEQKKKYKDLKFPGKTSQDLLAITGYHIGDGFISGNRTLRYKDADREMLEKYNKKFKEVFDIKGNIHERDGHYVLNVNSKYLADWFKENIPKALHKTGNEEIPDLIYKSSLEEVGAFVKGLFDAEGTVGIESKQLSVTMTSENLIDELKLLILKGEVLSTKYTNKREHEENWSEAHTLSINFKESIENFREWAGFSSEKKKQALSELEEKHTGQTYKHSSCYETQDETSLSARQEGSLLTDSRLEKILDGEEKYREMLESNLVWTRFEVHEKKSSYEKVYDLEVEKTKSFYAAGTVQHNSRWATHGGVTQENAHPHESCDGRFAVVHNGIIQNFEELKQQYNRHTYTSETDTEVIPHIIEEKTGQGQTVPEALQAFDEEAQGNYAVVVLDKQENQLYGLKRGSPLVFTMPKQGMAFKGAYFSSDLYALSDKTGEAYFMEDGDLIQTSGNNLAHWNNGELQDGPLNKKSFEWTEKEPKLENHEYWMEKEIKEIPDALQRIKRHLSKGQEGYEKGKELRTKIQNSERVILTASGTSYHAALLAVYYLQQNGVEAQALIASEFEHYERITEDTLLLAVSQSGETRDVLDAINLAESKGAEIASLVNVPHSTIQRKSDISIEIKAQQENCVAATKTFTNQVYTLMNLAGQDTRQILETVDKSLIGINHAALKDAREFWSQDHEDIYIIGNASTYPIAREIALKLKEISYIHAEGMMAGELKHGTLALIEEGTPVIALDDGTGNIQNTVEEVEARGATTKTLSNDDNDREGFVFQATMYGFFLTLHWAHLKQLPVDRPRNLAKSVTVK